MKKVLCLGMSFASGRKIIGASILLISALVVTYFKGDIPTNLTNFMEMIYLTFVLGNGWEYFTKMKITNNKENK